MTFQLIFTAQYDKRATRFLKHPPSLHLHTLSGRLQGLHSVSINLSYRITIELLIKDNEIIPINVGGHDVLH